MSIDKRILIGGNELASQLIATEMPNNLKTYDEALEKHGQPYAAMWSAWRAILDARDETNHQPVEYTALGDNDYHRIIKVMKAHIKPQIYYEIDDPKPCPKIPEIDFCTAAGIILRGMSPKREIVGLLPAQEPKYTVNGHAIVNRASLEEIPADEPVFILRARDAYAAEAIAQYAGSVGNREHAHAVWQRWYDFNAFARDHHERMKEPDTATNQIEGGN